MRSSPTGASPSPLSTRPAVTALSPVTGYDKAGAISYYAIDHDLTLKQAALANSVSEDLYDKPH